MDILQESTDNLFVIREKIIKTDEVLKLLGDKSKDLNKLERKYKKLLEKFFAKNQEKHSPLENEISELKTRYNLLESNHHEYVNAAEQKYQTACQEVEDSKKTVETFKKKIEQLEAKEKARKVQSKIEFQNKTEQLNLKLTTSANELKSLKKSHENLIKTHALEINSLNKKLQLIEKDLDKSLANAIDHELEKELFNEKVESLEQDLENIIAKKTEHEIEKKLLKDQIKSLENDLKKLTVKKLKSLSICTQTDIFQPEKVKNASVSTQTEIFESETYSVSTQTENINNKSEKPENISINTQTELVENIAIFKSEIAKNDSINMQTDIEENIELFESKKLENDDKIEIVNNKIEIVRHFTTANTQTEFVEILKLENKKKKSNVSISTQTENKTEITKIDNKTDSNSFNNNHETEKQIISISTQTENQETISTQTQTENISKIDSEKSASKTAEIKNKMISIGIQTQLEDFYNISDIFSEMTSVPNLISPLNPVIISKEINTQEKNTFTICVGSDEIIPKMKNSSTQTTENLFKISNTFPQINKYYEEETSKQKFRLKFREAGIVKKYKNDKNKLLNNIKNSKLNIKRILEKYLFKDSPVFIVSPSILKSSNNPITYPENYPNYYPCSCTNNIYNMQRNYPCNVMHNCNIACNCNNISFCNKRSCKLSSRKSRRKSSSSSSDSEYDERLQKMLKRCKKFVVRDYYKDKYRTKKNNYIRNKSRKNCDSELLNNRIQTLKRENRTTENESLSEKDYRKRRNRIICSSDSDDEDTSNSFSHKKNNLVNENLYLPKEANKNINADGSNHVPNIFSENSSLNPFGLQNSNKYPEQNLELTSNVLEINSFEVENDAKSNNNNYESLPSCDNVEIESKTKKNKKDCTNKAIRTRLLKKVSLLKKKTNNEIIRPKNSDKVSKKRINSNDSKDSKRKQKCSRDIEPESKKQKVELFGSESEADSPNGNNSEEVLTVTTISFDSDELNSSTLMNSISKKQHILEKYSDICTNKKNSPAVEYFEAPKPKKRIALQKKNSPVSSEDNKVVFKRPERGNFIPPCPKSPDVINYEVIQPKIIPLEKYEPPKIEMRFAKKMVADVATMDWDKGLLSTVSSSLSTQDSKFVARLIVNQIALDFSQEFDKSFTPPAPLLTTSQQKLLVLLKRLDCNLPDIHEDFLELAEQRLLSEKRVEVVHPLTRMFVAVCKLKYDIERVRMLCCNSAYYMGDLFVPLMFIVLTMWGDVLPMAANSADIPLAIVLVQIAQSKTCNNPGYNVSNLNNLISSYYEYPRGEKTNDQIMETLIKSFSENCSESAFTSILILCKNSPSAWKYSQVKKHLLPLVDKYKNDKERLDLISNTLLLINRISGMLNREQDKKFIDEINSKIASESDK